MATAGGPDIERNGLVFGYDTGYGVADNSTPTRFYPGAPTTNITVGTMTPYTPYNTLVRDGQNFTLTMVPGSAKYLTLHNGTNYNGQTLSYSGYMFKNGIPFNPLSTSTRPNTYQSAAGMSNQYYDPITGYFKFTLYFNVSSIWLFHQPVGAADNDIIQINDLQIEVKNYITPFVNGTRSSTQSLKDLTRTTNIDIYNVSFNSTGQPTFDGTDDYIQTSLTGINLDSQCTIEGVLQRKSTPTAWRTFFNLKPSGANTPFFEFRSSANSQHIYADYYSGTDYNTNAASFTTGTYGHAVAIYDGDGNVNMYFNGELIHTKTGVPSFSLGASPRLTVGRAYDNSRNTDIEAPIVKIYNRALTPQEVQQNYNAYKNRFNI
jgi:hypothetical protein